MHNILLSRRFVTSYLCESGFFALVALKAKESDCRNLMPASAGQNFQSLLEQKVCAAMNGYHLSEQC